MTMTTVKKNRLVSAYKSGRKSVAALKTQYRLSGTTFYNIMEQAGVAGLRSRSNGKTATNNSGTANN